MAKKVKSLAAAAAPANANADMKGKGKAMGSATEIDDIFAGGSKTKAVLAEETAGKDALATPSTSQAAKKKKRKREQDSVANAENKAPEVSLKELQEEKARRKAKPVEVVDGSSTGGLPGASTKKAKRALKPPPKQTEDDEIFRDSRGTSNRAYGRTVQRFTG